MLRLLLMLTCLLWAGFFNLWGATLGLTAMLDEEKKNRRRTLVTAMCIIVAGYGFVVLGAGIVIE